MLEKQKRSPILAPFAFLYGRGVAIRNFLFSKGYITSYMPKIPTICVGNIAVGGTGKTPMVEFLIKKLSDSYRVAVVSRGYKRTTHGMIVATKNSTAKEIGDEPRQILTNCPNITLVVDGNRKRALTFLEELPISERPEVIIMDDGLQHRKVIPHIRILLTAFHTPYFSDKLLPWGNLRENLSAVTNVDCVVVTKTPLSISPIELKLYARKLHLFENQKCFFSAIYYGVPKALFTNAPFCVSKSTVIIAFAGIADAQPFFDAIDKAYPSCVKEYCTYPDHHNYKKTDLKYLESLVTKFQSKNLSVQFITTQKDAEKLKHMSSAISPLIQNALFYIPIVIDFLGGSGEKFCNFIEQKISSFEQDLNSKP